MSPWVKWGAGLHFWSAFKRQGSTDLRLWHPPIPTHATSYWKWRISFTRSSVRSFIQEAFIQHYYSLITQDSHALLSLMKSQSNMEIGQKSYWHIVISTIIEAVTKSHGRTEGRDTCYVFSGAGWVGHIGTRSPWKKGELSPTRLRLSLVLNINRSFLVCLTIYPHSKYCWGPPGWERGGCL